MIVTSWLDGGMPGRHFIESAADVPRFIRSASRQVPHTSQWWIVNVGSMSKVDRQRLLHALEDQDCSIRKFTMRHMREIGRAARAYALPPSIPWYGWLLHVVLVPWGMIVLGIARAARLIGRGPRTYLVHVPIEPPNNDPPGGSGVREPRGPYPGGGELSQAILPPRE